MIVRHSYISVNSKRFRGISFGIAKQTAFGTALAHIKYIQHRPGPDREEGGRDFFNQESDQIDGKDVREALRALKTRGVVIHKLTLAPDVIPKDPREFTREVMQGLNEAKGTDLKWFAVEHRNTDHHHVHVVVLGKDANGKMVRFSKDDYKTMKEHGDRWLDRNHPIERRQKEFERNYSGRNLERRELALWRKIERKELAFERNKDSQRGSQNLNQSRWIPDAQIRAMANPAFGLFMSAAGIARTLVSWIDLKDRRDPLKESKKELEERRDEIKDILSKPSGTESQSTHKELLEKIEKAIERLEQPEEERRKRPSREDRDRDLDIQGGR